MQPVFDLQIFHFLLNFLSRGFHPLNKIAEAACVLDKMKEKRAGFEEAIKDMPEQLELSIEHANTLLASPWTKLKELKLCGECMLACTVWLQA